MIDLNNPRYKLIYEYPSSDPKHIAVANKFFAQGRCVACGSSIAGISKEGCGASRCIALEQSAADFKVEQYGD